MAALAATLLVCGGIHLCMHVTLRKLAYSNIIKIIQPKKGNFLIKTSDSFHISAQNIDYGYS